MSEIYHGLINSAHRIWSKSAPFIVRGEAKLSENKLTCKFDGVDVSSVITYVTPYIHTILQDKKDTYITVNILVLPYPNTHVVFI